MLTAIELHAPGVFDPDQIRVLVAALEDTWQKLLERGVRFGSDREAQAMRNVLAKYIIEQARQGERDQHRLREGALLHFAQLSLRKNPPK
jgi:hypothetical protein